MLKPVDITLGGCRLSLPRIAVFSLAFACGLAILFSPAAAAAVFGVILSVALLGAPSYAWVIAAILFASLSRIMVSFGFVSPLLNFFHFPLALAAAFFAWSHNPDKAVLPTTPLSAGMGLIFLVSLLSWAANGGEFMRPLFTWLVFCEPFLIIYALLKDPPSRRALNGLWYFILAIALLQVPLGLWQFARFGPGDTVQGTFVKMGAGAHVAAAVTLLGAFICISKILQKGPLPYRYCWVILAAILLVFPIISDAKQVFAVFFAAVLIILFRVERLKLGRAAVIILLGVFLAYAAMRAFPMFNMITDKNLILRGARGKIESVNIIAQKMSGSPMHWLAGLGPGNSVSRVALLASGGIVEKGSPVSFLNFHLAPATRDIIQLSWKTNPLFLSSSAWSGVSSWLGLFGDFGLLGLFLYLWMFFYLWRRLSSHSGWYVYAAKAALITAALLGGMFSWLEEPGFMLPAAAMAGLALAGE